MYITTYDKSGSVREVHNDYYSPETINPNWDATFIIDYSDFEESPDQNSAGLNVIDISLAKDEYVQGEPIYITVTLSSEMPQDYVVDYMELYFTPKLIAGNPHADKEGVYFDNSLFEINEDGNYVARMPIRVFDEAGNYKLVSGVAYDIFGDSVVISGEDFPIEFTVYENPKGTWTESFEDFYFGTGITSVVENVDRSDLQMIVSNVKDEVSEIPKELGTNYALYDIYFIEDWYGQKVDLGLPVTITIPYLSTLVPEKVYYFGEDFEIIEEIDFIDNGDSITFVSDTFSYFGIQFAETDTPGERTDTPGEGTDTPGETETPSVTVESTDVDLPPTGVASTAITSILGALFLSIGSALGFRKKKK